MRPGGLVATPAGAHAANAARFLRRDGGALVRVRIRALTLTLTLALTLSNPSPSPNPNPNPNPNQVLGGFAGMPLLFNEPLSLVGLVTLYSTGAIAAKIVLRWRFSKAYY